MTFVQNLQFPSSITSTSSTSTVDDYVSTSVHVLNDDTDEANLSQARSVLFPSEDSGVEKIKVNELAIRLHETWSEVQIASTKPILNQVCMWRRRALDDIIFTEFTTPSTGGEAESI